MQNVLGAIRQAPEKFPVTSPQRSSLRPRSLKTLKKSGMFEQTFKNVDDILQKDAGCTSELDYTEQSSWLLFLKYLDALEADKATEAALDGKKCQAILDDAFRWQAWAAPKDAKGKLDHNNAMMEEDLLQFVNG